MQSSTTKSTRRRLATAAILGAGSAVLMAGTAHADGLFGAGVGAGGAGSAEDPHTGAVALVGVQGSVATKLTVLETANDAPDHATDHLLKTYCIQRGVAVDPNGLYDEKGWANDDSKTGLQVPQLNGIKWILTHSYPQLDLTGITTAVNTGTPGAITTLTAQEAVEATQAAVWNQSDGSSLDEASATNDANVVALYKYLKAGATGTTDTSTPQLSLGISPSSVTGATAGDKVGPFSLTSSDGVSKFIHVVFDTDKGTLPAGAKIVDAGGNEVTPNTLLKDKEKVWVQIPDGAAKATIVLRAYGQLQAMDTGRIFVTDDPKKPTQNLIVASSHDVYVRDYVEIKFNAKPEVLPVATTTTTPPATTPSTPATTPPAVTPTTPALAHTGAGNTAALAGGAVALLAAGGGLVVYTRRSKRQGGAH